MSNFSFQLPNFGDMLKNLVQNFSPPPPAKTRYQVPSTVANAPIYQALIDNKINRPEAERQLQQATAAAIPSPTPVPAGSDYASIIKQAFERYNPAAPAATLSAELADAGVGLPDPFLPAKVAMKESSGGLNMTYPNNLMNILVPGRFDYPTIQSNINGGPGDERFSFKELINSPTYADYRTSGDPADFLKHYTPDHDKYGRRNSNPTIAEQVATLAALSKYFNP